MAKIKKLAGGGNSTDTLAEKVRRDLGDTETQRSFEDDKVTPSSGLDATPRFFVANKNFTGAGGRVNYTKQLDKDSTLRAYADLMAGKAAGQPAFITPQKVGLEYRKTFAKGGKVSASSRADGIAQRGKTRGKMC